ncbi:hypothetical protein LCGC14_2615770 [marine sediment metagenome]|uniref:Uncharacterized protein n=1 Tax=marine sediment metagenome TaxID=412755 RepID=A0A0F9A4H9_9ZZZZ
MNDPVPEYASTDPNIVAPLVDPRGRPAPEEPPKGHLLDEVRAAFEASWSLGTALRREWDEDNPAWGQCAATAVAFKRLFGGRIMRTTVYDPYQKEIRDDGVFKYKHFFNQDAQGVTVDFTAIQYSRRAEFHVNTREPYLRSLPFGQDVMQRAVKLERRVREHLAKIETTGMMGRLDVYRMIKIDA